MLFTLQVRVNSALEAVFNCSRREGETLADGILKMRVGEKCVVLTMIFFLILEAIKLFNYLLLVSNKNEISFEPILKNV